MTFKKTLDELTRVLRTNRNKNGGFRVERKMYLNNKGWKGDANTVTLRVEPTIDKTDYNRYVIDVSMESPTAITSLTATEAVKFAAQVSEMAHLTLQAENLVRGFSWRREEVEAYFMDEEYDANKAALEDCATRLRSGTSKIATIKYYREQTGTSLVDAKYAIDRLMQDLESYKHPPTEAS